MKNNDNNPRSAGSFASLTEVTDSKDGYVAVSFTAQLAINFVQTVDAAPWAKPSVPFDYTRASLRAFDEWAQKMRIRLPHTIASNRTKFLQRFPGVAAGGACYFGETIVRNLGGQWITAAEAKRRFPSQAPAFGQMIIVQTLSFDGSLREVAQVTDPTEFVLEILYGDKDSKVQAYFDLLAAGLRMGN